MTPIIMLLLFVDVFGGATSSSLAGASKIGATYIDYLVPGILVMTVGSGSMPTAVAVCTDMTEGIVARFRTMVWVNIARFGAVVWAIVARSAYAA